MRRKRAFSNQLIDSVAETTVSVFCDKKKFKEHKKTITKIEKGIEEVIEYRILLKKWNKDVESKFEKQNLETFINFALKDLQ